MASLFFLGYTRSPCLRLTRPSIALPSSYYGYCKFLGSSLMDSFNDTKKLFFVARSRVVEELRMEEKETLPTKREVQCYVCKEMGHISRDCPKNEGGGGNKDPGGNKPPPRGQKKKRKGYQGKKQVYDNNNDETKRPRRDGRGTRGEGEEEAEEGGEKQERSMWPKRKVALLIAYCGKNYVGLQRNPGVRTVEAELEQQLTAAGVISADNSGSFNKVGWQSCARTDKGVSALGNVISLKALLVPDFIDKVNELLPSDIRLLEWQRVTNHFSSKNKCTARKYHYVLPTSVFVPSTQHPEYHNHDSSKPFSLSPALRETVQDVLQLFIGCKEYHNFTSGGGPKRAGDARAKRVMISLDIGEPFVVDGLEYAEITIVGQSFVLYQIRKMVAMVICTVRDGQTKSVINACFQKPKKNLPVAPALGLFLGRTFFGFYNESCSPHQPLTWDASEDKMTKFKEDVVLPHITSTNKTEDVYTKWLATLDETPLNYDFLRCTTFEEITEKFPLWTSGGPPQEEPEGAGGEVSD